MKVVVRIIDGINGLRDMIARVRNNDSLGGYICRNMPEENNDNMALRVVTSFPLRLGNLVSQ